MEIIIFIIALFSINAQSLDIKTIDLRLNSDNFYRIKNIDSELKFNYNNITNVNLLPKKYLNLIIMILKNQKIFYDCRMKSYRSNNIYFEVNFCQKNTGIKDLKIELNFDFGTFNISLTESQIFSIEDVTTYYFNFWTNDNIDNVVISDVLINANLRNLENDNYEGKNIVGSYNKDNNKSKNNVNKRINKINIKNPQQPL